MDFNHPQSPSILSEIEAKFPDTLNLFDLLSNCKVWLQFFGFMAKIEIFLKNQLKYWMSLEVSC